MKIIDITGNIYTGMWSMGPPFPEYELKETETPEWLEYKVYSEIFDGLFEPLFDIYTWLPLKLLFGQGIVWLAPKGVILWKGLKDNF